jgi:dTDP-4-dehydrorhamnose reductase
VGKALGALANRGDFEHPVISAPGWWRRPSRMIEGRAAAPACSSSRSRPLVITGATGTLGTAFAKVCGERGLDHVVLRRRDMDIADTDSVDRALRELRPWAVVNAAGFVRVDEAEDHPDDCFRENARGPLVLGRACQRLAIGLLSFSSDLVFDGRKSSAYVESDRPSPLGVYGRTKAEAERQLEHEVPEALIVRTSAFFGPWDCHNFVAAVLRTIRGGGVFHASQSIISPTYVPDLCHASLDLLLDGEHGVFHLANRGEISWADFARSAALLASLDPGLILARPDSELGHRAARPRYSVLASERAWLMPTLDDALARYFRDLGVDR